MQAPYFFISRVNVKERIFLLFFRISETEFTDSEELEDRPREKRDKNRDFPSYICFKAEFCFFLGAESSPGQRFFHLEITASIEQHYIGRSAVVKHSPDRDPGKLKITAEFPEIPFLFRSDSW